VSFDVQDLINGGVVFDEDNDCLIINNLPQELINEIKTHKATDNESVA